MSKSFFIKKELPTFRRMRKSKNLSACSGSIEGLSSVEKEVLFHVLHVGADCAKFIARELHLELDDIMKLLQELRQKGFLKRVEGRFLKPKGWRKVKHMNHTYYTLTRKAKLMLRDKRCSLLR